MTRILFETGMPFVYVATAAVATSGSEASCADVKRKGSVSAECYSVVENLSNGWEALLVGLSRSHPYSGVHSVPQVFFINLNLRTITAKL